MPVRGPATTDERTLLIEAACEAYDPGFLSTMEANRGSWPDAPERERERMGRAVDAVIWTLARRSVDGGENQ